MVVAPSVALHEGAHESAAALPVALPANEANSLVVEPLLMMAPLLEAGCVAPTVKALIRAFTVAVTSAEVERPSGLVTVNRYTVLDWTLFTVVVPPDGPGTITALIRAVPPFAS